MSRYARQFAAAASAYDNASPPEPDDRDPSDAIDTIATRMAVEFEVGEVLEDLHDSGYTAGALDRLIRGRAPWPGDESSLRRLLGRVEWLAGEVEKEMQP